MLHTVKDEETGLTLHYSWDEQTGWSFRVSGYSSREERRAAVKASLKHWPETPEKDKARIDKNNEDILKFCKDFSNGR